MRRFSRRVSVLAALLALSLSLSIPALALFDREEDAGGRPIAENFALSTYKNVAVSGALSAVDPEGDPITFRVTRNPARGELTFADGDPSRFTYTPYENKTGKDSFTYVAEDAEGNVSQEATVSIRIEKPATKVTYADMDGHPAHKAAIALAEEEVLIGERLGETWFFRPDRSVTREEFLAMAMDVVGLETLPDAAMTGFTADESISAWAKPYVASALRSGMVQGGEGARFAPDRAITQTEAAVMLNRLLRISDVSAWGKLNGDAAPAWAYQSVVNLTAVGVLSPQPDGTVTLAETLTRADAAQMLLAAMEVLDFRDRVW